MWCKGIYVCIYVHKYYTHKLGSYGWMYIHMYVYVYVIYTGTHLDMPIRRHTGDHIFMHIWVMSPYVYICMYVEDMYICKYIHTHITYRYVYMCIFIHICIYVFRQIHAHMCACKHINT